MIRRAMAVLMAGCLVPIASPVIQTQSSATKKKSSKTTNTSSKKSTPAKSATAKSKTPANSKAPAKTTARRRTPRPTAVIVPAAQRTSAAEAVSRWLDVPSSLENPAALVPFLEQLFRLEKGLDAQPLRILHYGDSHTASDDWPGTLRYLFQSKFGDGGAGFSHAGRPWNSYRRYDVASSSSTHWYTDGLFSRQGDGLYGLSAVSITSKRQREWITLDASCSAAELMYLQRPGGGAFEISVDRESPQRIETEGELKPGYVKVPLSPGMHRFEVRTADSRPVRLFGWVTENQRGVTYETLGINGAQANMLLNVDERLFTEHIVRRDPALIILAYGTNEAGAKDWTLDSYRDTFSQLLQRLRRAAPSASILVVGPPDRYIRSRSTGWQPLDNVDMIVEAQRAAAIANRCAFFDLRARMGGKGAMRQWVFAGLAQPDYVHLTGQGYRLVGAALYKEITGQYALYSSLRSRPETLLRDPDPTKVTYEQTGTNR